MELSTDYVFVWRRRAGQLWLTFDWGAANHAVRFHVPLAGKDYDRAILDMLELLRQRRVKDRPFQCARAPGSKRMIWRGGIRPRYSMAARLTQFAEQYDEITQCAEMADSGIIATAEFKPAHGWRVRPVIELRNREARTLFAFLTLGHEMIEPPQFKP